MKALVWGMGVLIVIGTTVVVGTVVHRLYARFAAPSTPAALTAPPAPVREGAASLQPGEHIAAIAAAGADVAVWVKGPGGDRLLLVHPASGQVRAVLRSAH